MLACLLQYSHEVEILRNSTRFEVFEAAAIKFVTPYSRLNRQQNFGVTSYLNIEGRDGGTRFLRNVCISEDITLGLILS